ncbi:DUF159 family protein [Amycolatopsis antarctica]|uniref:Abasic site processing protein n=1 Tax=Amycolatopsis antarctica TaxID=1854586 RepID=A0A263D8J1_9PSEU|nr:SOS response-associated peptidase [Amycolatopsis antarctica]OZM73705.1 DUF159 family protein [Amycolatopsis antarctica]
MCGRYAATKDPATLTAEFAALDETGGDAFRADHNVAPTKDVVTVVQRHPRDAEGRVLADEPATRTLRVMRWGLVPFWAKDPAMGSRMINARAESAAEKPAFRKALRARRCLVPADGWFEWRAGTNGTAGAAKKTPKQPYYMTPKDGSPLAMAGLWETWRDPRGEPDQAPLITFSVLTTDAVGQLQDVHHRMPLLLPRTYWDTWLDPDNAEVDELLTPPSLELADALELRPVSTLVNNVRNNGAELVERAEQAVPDLDPAAGAPDEAGQGALFGTPER